MWVLLVMLTGFWGVFMALAPRAMARMQAIGYKHPEAHEPSGGAVVMYRVLGIVLAFLMFAVFLPAAAAKDDAPATEPSPSYETGEPWRPTTQPMEKRCEPGTFLCGDDGRPLVDSLEGSS